MARRKKVKVNYILQTNDKILHQLESLKNISKIKDRKECKIC